MTLHCSFCGKAQHEVVTLIAGPNVFICGDCVQDCVDIVAERERSQPEENVRKMVSRDLRKR